MSSNQLHLRMNYNQILQFASMAINSNPNHPNNKLFKPTNNYVNNTLLSNYNRKQLRNYLISLLLEEYIIPIELIDIILDYIVELILICGNSDGDIIYYSINNYKVYYKTEIHTDVISAFVNLNDNNHIISSSLDGNIKFHRNNYHNNNQVRFQEIDKINIENGGNAIHVWCMTFAIIPNPHYSQLQNNNNNTNNDTNQYSNGNSAYLSVLIVSCGQSSIMVYNLHSLSHMYSLPGHTAKVTAFTTLYNQHQSDNFISTRLISSSWDCTLRVYNLTTLHCEFVLKEHKKYVNTVIKLNDNTIASASQQGDIRIWHIPQTNNNHANCGDIASEAYPQNSNNSKNDIHYASLKLQGVASVTPPALLFNYPDHKLDAIDSNSTTQKTQLLSSIHIIQANQSNAVTSLLFVPDYPTTSNALLSGLLISADKTLKIWRINRLMNSNPTHKLVQELVENSDNPNALVSSITSMVRLSHSRIAVSYMNKCIIIWNIANFRINNTNNSCINTTNTDNCIINPEWNLQLEHKICGLDRSIRSMIVYENFN